MNEVKVNQTSARPYRAKYKPANETSEDNSPRIRYDRKNGARVLSMCIRAYDYRLSTGKLASFRDGKKVYVLHTELMRYAREHHFEPFRT